jgi:UDP-N-acetylmuramate--alanine ligase
VNRRIHLVGIGGIGLSAIAKILLAQGVAVSGSDLKSSPMTEELQKLGAEIFIGHRAENVGDVDLVLVTSAAQADNPEVLEAKRRGIRVEKRYEFFPELTNGKKVVAVAGTHGKTTTTGMIGAILTHAGFDPSVIVGGMIPELNGNARAGKGEYFVIEADEYDRAFLGLTPRVAVVTTIEMDHPDIYRNVAAVADAFREFMNQVEVDGIVIGCGDDARVANELNQAKRKTIRYGFGAENEWRVMDIKPNALGGNDFAVQHHQFPITNYQLQIPGSHNVLNALAAIAVADEIGIEPRVVQETLRNFRGAARRFEIIGEFNGVTVIDDYAHHPTEIRATLAAARERFPNRALWAVFQPHTFTRTRALLDEFACAFDEADHVIITEIFAARETDTVGTSGRDVVARMTHRDARFIAPLDEAAEYIAQNARAGEVLITLGAGDVNQVGARFAQRAGGTHARII